MPNKVQHVLSGEARYFRDWGALVGHLLAPLLDVGPAGPIEMEDEYRSPFAPRRRGPA